MGIFPKRIFDIFLLRQISSLSQHGLLLFLVIDEAFLAKVIVSVTKQ